MRGARALHHLDRMAAAVLAATVDLVHALLMAAWALGLPLLFWRRWPRATRAYAAYAIAFVVVNQLSQALLGECILTVVARALWEHAPAGADLGGAGATDEWFTVRLARAVFGLTPSHHAIKVASEVLILATAAGVLVRPPRRDGTPARARPAAA
jgi:hypothetical protein